ncbi:MAG: anaerobic sulfatase maturase [Thermomicrobiales bacterium]|nr:anaerobic sulfatase maturase [Thermomicrobiales bacterium]
MATDFHPPAGAPPGFHVLAKPTGAVCNLNCTYCFFLSKQALYPGSRFRMSDEVLETYIKQLFEAHQTPEVTVAWQGGEPTLMGVDFFERAVRLAERYRRPGQRVAHTIQTNGTLLDDAWGAFFKQHEFLVGLSVDGPQELHDAYRVDRRGQGSFDRVRRGWDTLVKHEVDANILCTVHAANGDHPLAVYRYFRDELNAQFLQFIPIVERATETVLRLADAGWGGRRGSPRPLYTQSGDLVTERSVRPEQFGHFLIAIFDEWVRHDVGRVFVQHFDAALANWCGLPAGVCIFQETCGAALALEHTGDVYSCDHYVEPDYNLGNIRETHLVDLLVSPRQVEFGLHKRDALPAYCRACPVRFACHGECPRNRFLTTPDGEPGLNYLCAGYRRFFEHIDQPMRFMAEMLRRGLAPAEIMRRYAADDDRLRVAFARAGRNETCPCGSGRKFKHCHGSASA